MLIHGGTSGIGTTAIQLARAFGADTFLRRCAPRQRPRRSSKLGADHAIQYQDNDWAAEVKKPSDGVDIVLDMVAGDYMQRNLHVLTVERRLVVIAVQLGSMARSVPAMSTKRLTITGSTLRPRTIEQKGAIAAGLLKNVWPLIEAGKVKPVIYKTFPLAEAAAAHRLLERAEHIGKIVLTV